ncbi:MAG TPA: glycosyltransferase family 9 protein [Opitutaceae bacterium]|nr:glycosyltransferase family 9 protein [Opitutaceae bacterium]
MKILVSKPDAFGDQILVAGFVQALRRECPDARIVWHVRAGMEAIARLVADAAVFAPNSRAAPETEAMRLWRETTAPIVVVPGAIAPFENWEPGLNERYVWWGRFLAATEWDIAVAPVVNRTGLSDFTVTASRAKHRFAFATNRACQPMIEAAFAPLPNQRPEFTREIPSSLEESEWTQHAALLAVIAPQQKLWPPALQISATADTEARVRLGQLLRPLVLLAPGVGENTQRAWPLARFLELAAALRQRECDVRWINGPHDAAYFESLPASEAAATLAIEAARPDVLAALMRHARLVVCNDTAYVHLAAALDVSTVAIFGAGQKRRFVPQFGRVHVVQGDPVCRGCQWQCAFSRHVCVQDVPFDAVFGAALAQLAAPEAALRPLPLALPLDPPRDHIGELEWARDWFQQELNFLRWDGWARLQIINDVIERLKTQDRVITQVSTERDALRALAPAPVPNQSALPPAPGPALPKLSVIVPMGRPERADATLRSLLDQTLRPPNWEVVVVGVGASNVRERHPELPLVPVDLAHNLLPPHTRATGVAHATGEWFVFVDDDIRLARDFFEMLARILAAPSNLQAQVPAPVGAIGVKLPGGRGTYFEHLTDISNFWSQQSSIRAVPHTVWFLYSATFVVRAEAYHRAGGFNIELPNGEDVDLTQRIKASGYILAYEPSLVAYHHHGRDSLFRMWRYFWRNGNAAQYFFAQLGGVCCYSVRTVLKRWWGDVRMNRNFQRTQGVKLGLRLPWVALNYLIVETSLEWHYQEYLWKSKKFITLPARTASDRLAFEAFRHLDAGRKFRGAATYALAMLRNFADPVRR